MTENESLKIMLAYKFGRGCKPHYSDEEIEKAFDTAISALQEIQQYREIGIVEECREAVEKQKAQARNESVVGKIPISGKKARKNNGCSEIFKREKKNVR